MRQKINLDDDYIKFIRYAEHYIENNGYGIVAMITNNSFLDGITHRQMRKHLLETFDTIYIYDLHGSANKKETAPDGSPDKNVFDIMQGVSINIFVKHKEGKNGLADVFHHDSYGTREVKYAELWDKSIDNAGFTILTYATPYYFFVPKEFKAEKVYNSGFKLNEILTQNLSGIETQRDAVSIFFDSHTLARLKADFLKSDEATLREKYNIGDDGRDWTLKEAIRDINTSATLDAKLLFKPFDFRRILYTGHTKGIVAYPRHEIQRHLLMKNVAIICPRFFKDDASYFVSSGLTAHKSLSVYDKNFVFPLYLYPTDDAQHTLGGKEKRAPNLDKKIVERLSKKLGTTFVSDDQDTKADGKTAFSPLDVLDYIYAMLHSPTYRETYKEFLKIDFPRIPYPNDAKAFWQLVAIGKEIRLLHLLESPTLSKFTNNYPVSGDNAVEKIEYEGGKVYINKDQYFSGVPEVAWSFYIGGYQPAQKWLKDRKGRQLNFDDITHYQKIIVALTETDRLMKKIDTLWKP
jgi:predicted helicase